MKRALWTLLGIILVSGLTYYVMTHPSLDRARHLSAELDKLKAENQQLRETNENLTLKVEALRDDPRLAERRAREVAGLVRADEIILQFDRPRESSPIQVDLNVGPDTCTLAGETLRLEDLEGALSELKSQLPGAIVNTHFSEDVDAIRRQQVVDALARSDVETKRL